MAVAEFKMSIVNKLKNSKKWRKNNELNSVRSILTRQSNHQLAFDKTSEACLSDQNSSSQVGKEKQFDLFCDNSAAMLE